MSSSSFGRWPLTLRRRLVAGVSGLLIAGTLAACGNVSNSSESGSGSGDDDLSANCPDTMSQGITDDTVKVGVSSALSGPAANATPKGVNAYFDYVNSQGGVEMGDGKKRKIEYTILDDAYEPARTRANVEKLINSEKVFAMVGNYGTTGNIASREVVEKACIPSLYMITGHPEMGNPDYTWTMAPALASIMAEARAAAAYIEGIKADAKIAILVQNDELGQAQRASFMKGLEGTDAKVVKEEVFAPTDTSVNAQITTLAASGADYFAMLSASGTFQLQALEAIAKSDWDPQIKYTLAIQPAYLEQVSKKAAENVFFNYYIKDPENPEYKDDPAVELFNTWWAKQDGIDSFAPFAGQLGWMSGLMFVENLKSMKEPSRVDLIEAARTLTLDEENLYIPGVKYSIDWPKLPYGLVDLAIVRYDPEGKGTKLKQVELIEQGGDILYESSK